jgi:RNA polymerase sigma-70 factor, ECF subfamily
VLWKKFGEFKPGTSFFAWACQTAHYLVLNYRRRKKYPTVLDDDVLERVAVVLPEDEDVLRIRRTALYARLSKLAPKDRLLFERRYASTTKGKDLAAENWYLIT